MVFGLIIQTLSKTSAAIIGTTVDTNTEANKVYIDKKNEGDGKEVLRRDRGLVGQPTNSEICLKNSSRKDQANILDNEACQMNKFGKSIGEGQVNIRDNMIRRKNQYISKNKKVSQKNNRIWFSSNSQTT